MREATVPSEHNEAITERIGDCLSDPISGSLCATLVVAVKLLVANCVAGKAVSF